MIYFFHTQDDGEPTIPKSPYETVQPSYDPSFDYNATPIDDQYNTPMEVLAVDTIVAHHAMDHHLGYMFKGEPHLNVTRKTTPDINVASGVENEVLQSPITEVC